MKQYSCVTALGVMVLLGACGQKQSEPAVEGGTKATSMGPAFAGPSAVITDSPCTGTKNAKSVIFVVSNKILKTMGGSDQHVDRDVNTEENNVETPQLPPPYTVNSYQPTYLDIRVPAPGGLGMWTEIVVKLKNKNTDGIRFMPVRNSGGIDSPTDSSFAVMAEASKVPQFCGRGAFGEQDKGNDLVRFGVKLAAHETASINIGLLIEDKKNSTPAEKYWIPIYLDPNMKNTG